MSETVATQPQERAKFPLHGWVGIGLVVVFWVLNWSLSGPRTHWGFFPMWLGYCLAVDGLVYWRSGTSLLIRSRRRYIGLFLISSLVWWFFEAANTRLQNWHYVGAEILTPAAYAVWATLSFTTVIPAVFGSAELFSGMSFVRQLGKGPVIRPSRLAAWVLLITGVVMFALMWAWPQLFFPFLWISVYFITEPINIWLGYRNLGDSTASGDWRPVIALWLGVLLTAFFWEMWNYLAYPKWVYSVPWGQFGHVFEMPILGYGGYLPFALELYAIYNLVTGLLGNKDRNYVRID